MGPLDKVSSPSVGLGEDHRGLGRTADVGSSLLHAPAKADRAGLEDAMTLVYKLISSQRGMQMQRSKAELSFGTQQREHDMNAALEAVRAQQEASGEGRRGFFGELGHIVGTIAQDVEHLRVIDVFTDTRDNLSEIADNPKFWKELSSGGSEVAKWGAVVGSCVVAVGSFGTCTAVAVLAIAGAVLSSAGAVDSETHWGAKALGEKAGGWLDFSLSIGGAVCSAGAGLVAAGGAAANTGSATAGSAAKAATATADHAAKGLTAFQSATRTAGSVVSVSSGAANVVSGTAGVEIAKFDSRIDDAKGDELTARQHGAAMDRLIHKVIDGMKALDDSCNRSLRSLQGAIQTNDQTQLIAESMRA